MLLQWLCTATVSWEPGTDQVPAIDNEEYAPLVWPDRDENVLKCHN